MRLIFDNYVVICILKEKSDALFKSYFWTVPKAIPMLYTKSYNFSTILHNFFLKNIATCARVQKKDAAIYATSLFSTNACFL